MKAGKGARWHARACGACACACVTADPACTPAQTHTPLSPCRAMSAETRAEIIPAPHVLRTSNTTHANTYTQYMKLPGGIVANPNTHTNTHTANTHTHAHQAASSPTPTAPRSSRSSPSRRCTAPPASSAWSSRRTRRVRVPGFLGVCVCVSARVCVTSSASSSRRTRHVRVCVRVCVCVSAGVSV